MKPMLPAPITAIFTGLGSLLGEWIAFRESSSKPAYLSFAANCFSKSSINARKSLTNSWGTPRG